MSYTTAKTALYKRPITIVDIVTGYCSNVWNTAPCAPLAGQTYCFNTYPTCVDSDGAVAIDKVNFAATTKTYQFCKTTDMQLADTIRPYVISISDLPQKISNKISVKQRITIEMQDEPDTDVGIDLYYSLRTGYTTPSAIPGTFWQKWMARNPNYRNATVKIKEGFEGMAEADFQITFVGTIDNIKTERGKVRIQCVDSWKALEDFKRPYKINATLAADITTGTSITFTLVCDSNTILPTTNSWLKIGDEILYYSTYNLSTKLVTLPGGACRGIAGTTAAAHLAGAKVEHVWCIWGNAYFVMRLLIAQAGLSYDTSFEDLINNLVAITPFVGTVLTTPTSFATLYFELVQLMQCKSWYDIVSGAAVVTLRSDLLYDEWSGTLPTFISAMPSINDESGIISASKNIEGNEDSQYSNFELYYDAPLFSSISEDNAALIYRGVNEDAYNANFYGDTYKTIFTRWWNTYNENFEADPKNLMSFVLTYLTNYLGIKALAAHANANTKLTFESELKDEFYQGQFVKVTTNEVINIYGNPITDQVFQVIEKSKTGLIKHKYLLEKVISYA